jgi:hypothetical protein
MGEPFTWDTATGLALGLPADSPSFVGVRVERLGAHLVSWEMVSQNASAESPRQTSQVDFDWPERWADFRLELFGLLRAVESWPVDWPCWAFPTDRARAPQQGDLAVEVLLTRAMRAGSIVYPEIRYYPESATRYSAIRNAERPEITKDDLWSARRGFGLLEGFVGQYDNRGRRPAIASLEEFMVLEPQRRAELADAGLETGVLDVAGALGMSAATYHRYKAAARARSQI